MTFVHVLLLSQLAFGHGENKSGPNGGFVRMPGAFHTEVVVPGPSAKPLGYFDVYLLDLNIKISSIKKSWVKAKLINHEGNSVDLACRVKGTFFRCTLPKGEALRTGRLVVDASREGAVGESAIYDLPLKLGHAHHH